MGALPVEDLAPKELGAAKQTRENISTSAHCPLYLWELVMTQGMAQQVKQERGLADQVEAMDELQVYK